MIKKIDITQTVRHIVQICAFILFPGLFLSVFNAMKDIVTALVSGSFSLSALAGRMVLLLAVFGITALWGRFFCGYLCSFGAVQELVTWLSHKLMPRLRSVPSQLDRWLKYAKYAMLVLVVLFVWVIQLPVDSSLNPWGVFGMLVSGNLSVMSAAIPTIGFVLLVGILIGSVFAERFFCRYLCPLGALFTLISSHRLFSIKRSRKACINCGMCSRKCAMGINVCASKRISSGECIDCMRCVSLCRFDALHTNPHPAFAGTAAALMMYGMIHVGDILTENLSANTVFRPAEALNETLGQYADGIYTGTGDGFRGDVQVKVTVEKGNITDISVLSYRDDSQYFNKAQSSVIPAIIRQQTPEVGAVSGATFSSGGIMEAVANALENAGYIGMNVQNSINSFTFEEEQNAASNNGHSTRTGKAGSYTEQDSTNGEKIEATISSNSEDKDTSVPGLYKDGVYTGSGKGLRGDTQVQVTVSGGRISDITVTSYSDDRQYFSRAQGSMIDRIIESQGINVSTVSGATYSSNSILEAVADALDIDFSNPNSSMGSGKKGGRMH